MACAQQYAPALTDSLIASAMQEIFDPQNYTGGSKVYMELDSLTARLPAKFKGFKVEYLTGGEFREMLCWKSRKSATFCKLDVWVRGDTLDINISSRDMEILRVDFVKGVSRNVIVGVAVGCGGKIGYIPSYRYVYHPETQCWKAFTFQEMMEEKVRRRAINKE